MASKLSSKVSNFLSFPISQFKVNFIPASINQSILLCIRYLSSLKPGIPYVSSPPAFGSLSNISTSIPALNKYVAVLIPAGPLPTIATFLPILFFVNTGFIPFSNAVSLICVSIDPIVIAPCVSLSVQSPSQSTSCGQILPNISGNGDVSFDILNAISRSFSATCFNHAGIILCNGHLL